MAGRPLLHRAELGLIRSITRLPKPLLLLLSGGKTITLDGLELDPQIQFVLAGRRLLGRGGLRAGDPDVSRRATRADAGKYAETPDPSVTVRDLTIPLAVSSRAARHYSPSPEPGLPLLVFFHGGGFVTGDLDTHDAPCRLLCQHARVHVLAVDYRLAPEDPFPAPVEDAKAAFAWARANAASLGAANDLVGVGGDSAGGNLATVVCQEARRESKPLPAFQLLIYPVTDQSRSTRSRELFAEGFFLTAGDIEWFTGHYFGARPDAALDPRASPLLEKDLAGLPPAIVVTAGFDPLRDEGDAYAAALQAAGVKTVHKRYLGLIHAFINMSGVSSHARDAVIDVAHVLGETARGK